MSLRLPGALLVIGVVFFSQTSTGFGTESAIQPTSDTFEILGTITGKQPLVLIKSDAGKQLLGLNDSIGKYRIISIRKSGIQVSQGKHIHWLPLALRVDLQTETNDPDHTAITSPSPIRISAALLDDIGNHPQKWLSAVQLEPVIEEGWLTGYLIKAIQAPALVNNLNLQEGDIIRQVNGIDVRQATQFSKVINELSRESDIYFVLQREQQLLHVHFTVSD